MKKSIFLLLLIPITLNAQLQSICDITSSCANNTPCGLQPYHTASIDLDFSNEPPLVINIFFHDADPLVPIELTEADFLASTAYLNQTFNKFNIFFKYRGFDTEDQPIENMLNIFTWSLFVGGTAWDDGARVTYKSFINEGNTRFILAHEIGHIFCLLHADHLTNNTIDTFNNPLSCNGQAITEGNFPVFDSCDENVTRETSNQDYNAHIAGDYVIDTPAMYLKVNQCIDFSTSTLAYLFSNEVVDAVGTPYNNIDVNNIMARDMRIEFFEFKDNFTDGQGVRMRESIENRAVLQALLAPVSSLYEPYAGSYPNLFPYANEDGFPLFQPGFEYKFVECNWDNNGTEPIEYGNTNFYVDTDNLVKLVSTYESDYSTITHPNFTAIIISQIDDEAQKCYSNYSSPPIIVPGGGTIIQFNDNVFNTNVTITQHDSLSFNDENLINNLEPGLYNIIEQYEDGSTEQQIIFKENNGE
jgi:hypothetical protein